MAAHPRRRRAARRRRVAWIFRVRRLQRMAKRGDRDAIEELRKKYGLRSLTLNGEKIF
jgi:hypothetical protein